MDLLPELRWTAAALPATELTLVAVFSPEDQTVRASGVAVPEDSEPPPPRSGASSRRSWTGSWPWTRRPPTVR